MRRGEEKWGRLWVRHVAAASPETPLPLELLARRRATAHRSRRGGVERRSRSLHRDGRRALAAREALVAHAAGAVLTIAKHVLRDRREHSLGLTAQQRRNASRVLCILGLQRTAIGGISGRTSRVWIYRRQPIPIFSRGRRLKRMRAHVHSTRPVCESDALWEASAGTSRMRGPGARRAHKRPVEALTSAEFGAVRERRGDRRGLGAGERLRRHWRQVELGDFDEEVRGDVDVVEHFGAASETRQREAQVGGRVREPVVLELLHRLLALLVAAARLELELEEVLEEALEREQTGGRVLRELVPRAAPRLDIFGALTRARERQRGHFGRQREDHRETRDVPVAALVARRARRELQQLELAVLPKEVARRAQEQWRVECSLQLAAR